MIASNTPGQDTKECDFTLVMLPVTPLVDCVKMLHCFEMKDDPRLYISVMEDSIQFKRLGDGNTLLQSCILRNQFDVYVIAKPTHFSVSFSLFQVLMNKCENKIVLRYKKGHLYLAVEIKHEYKKLKIDTNPWEGLCIPNIDYSVEVQVSAHGFREALLSQQSMMIDLKMEKEESCTKVTLHDLLDVWNVQKMIQDVSLSFSVERMKSCLSALSASTSLILCAHELYPLKMIFHVSDSFEIIYHIKQE